MNAATSPRSVAADDLATALAQRVHGETIVDGPAFEPERLIVRGRDLNDLIGILDPVEMFALVAWGEEIDSQRRRELDTALRLVADVLAAGHPAGRAARAAAEAGAGTIGSIVAGLAIGVDEIAVQLGTVAPHQRESVAYFGALPSLLAAALGRPLSPARAVDDFGRRFLGSLAAREPRELTEAETQAFAAILVSQQAGFGVLTPTVMLPRIAAGTRAELRLCLVAGFAGSGSAHVGACDDAIRLLRRVRQSRLGDTGDRAVEDVLRSEIANVARVPGFGHPLFRADPRVPRLRSYLGGLALPTGFLTDFDALHDVMRRRFELHPNIDSISAAVFAGLNLPPESGTGVFLCMRAAAMIAHASEARLRPRFGVRSATARAAITRLGRAGALPG